MRDELSGDFEEVIVALLMSSSQYDAYCLHEAMDGLGTDETVLNGILTSRSAQVWCNIIQIIVTTVML